EAERFATDLALNRPLYDAFVDLDVSQEDPETKYAVRKILRDFRLAGVDRDAATRERIKGLRDEMTATGQDFDRTIREDERSIQVDGAADLAGLPADFVKAHPPGPDGKITITTKYPDIIPVFRYARDSEILIARKRKDVPNATSLQAWDTNFYSELVRAENFDFDAKLLRPYFAFGKVLEGLFEITRELFGVRYERVSGVPVWHPSVDV